jgi:hypothetical protein
VSKHELRPGLDRERLVELLGEPDEIEYLQNSFRPPGASEDREVYGEALREWELKTTGEVWRYAKPRLTLSVSKAGALVSWSGEED